MDETRFSEWPHLFREGEGSVQDVTGPASSPSQGDAPVLLMLHGTGSTEVEIAALAERLDPALAVLAPRGRVSESGANRWFRRLAEGVFDVDDVIRRAADLAAFIGWAREHYALGGRPLIAVGFSNGANMALALALLHPDVADRVIAFSGMYPLAERDAPEQLGSTRMLLLNGSDDAMAPSASVDRLASQLEARGATVERITRAGGHGIASAELEAAEHWMRQVEAR